LPYSEKILTRNKRKEKESKFFKINEKKNVNTRNKLHCEYKPLVTKNDGHSRKKNYVWKDYFLEVHKYKRRDRVNGGGGQRVPARGEDK
jgi:hypothetical protein